MQIKQVHYKLSDHFFRKLNQKIIQFDNKTLYLHPNKT